ncbi:MAG: hypothetical protein MUF01_14440 [Bryobacterales bacterium]|nr:hypothetical protein [Bryobacterales bacterium]
MYRNLANGVAVQALPSEIAAVPGGIVLRDPKATDFEGLFHAYCRYFRQNNRWRWNGGSMTPSAGDILDGIRAEGQCAALANAFRFLATHPKPYGLGISAAQVGMAAGANAGQYDGRHGYGFVARHRDNTGGASVLQLPANVFQAPAHGSAFTVVSLATPRTEYYLWANHKTIPYMGRYFDPSYGKIWDSKEQMAHLHIDHAEPLKRVEYDAQNRQIITEYSRAVGTTGTFYFRDLTTNEAMAVNMRGYQGPFAALPGKEWSGPSVAMIKQMKFNK